MSEIVQSVRRPARVLVTAIACSALVFVAGCQTTDVARYQAASDNCAQYRQPMIQVVQTMDQPISPGAVIGGALLGAAVGAVASGGKGGAIAAGALVGGMSGAAVSYYNSRAKIAKSQAELVAAIDTDANTDARRFSTVGSSMVSLSACRNRQISELAISVRAGQISKENAIKLRNEIRGYVTLDGELIDKVVGQVKGRSDVYVQAQMQALRRAGDQKPQVAANSGVQLSVNSANAVEKQGESAKKSTTTNLQSLDALLS